MSRTLGLAVLLLFVTVPQSLCMDIKEAAALTSTESVNKIFEENSADGKMDEKNFEVSACVAQYNRALGAAQQCNEA